MLIGGGALALVLLLVWVFALFDVIASPADQVRNLPKVLWLLIVALLGGLLVGPVLWFIAGRPRPDGVGSARPKPQRRLRDVTKSPGGVTRPTALRPPSRTRPAALPAAADPDHELFLALKKNNEEHEEMLRRWENDLRGREEALRRERAALAGQRTEGSDAAGTSGSPLGEYDGSAGAGDASGTGSGTGTDAPG